MENRAARGALCWRRRVDFRTSKRRVTSQIQEIPWFLKVQVANKLLPYYYIRRSVLLYNLTGIWLYDKCMALMANTCAICNIVVQACCSVGIGRPTRIRFFSSAIYIPGWAIR